MSTPIEKYTNIWASKLKDPVRTDKAELKERLSAIEGVEPVSLIEFIDSDNYLGMKDVCYPVIKDILDKFYNPLNYKDFFFDNGVPAEELDNLKFNELILDLGMK